MQLWQTNPFRDITIAGASGCTVRDTAGRCYLDLLSGTWCNVLGYGHPRWVAAIQEQAALPAHVGPSFPTAEIEAALRKLGEILPPQLDRAVFLNTGSEAVELALKMARAATGGDAVVVQERGYYGATTYALGLSEIGRSASYLPTHGHAVRLPLPDCKRCPAGRSWPCDDFPCLNVSGASPASHGAPVAAVLYEPVLANGGVTVPPIGYGTRLHELAARCGAMLIAEEVTTGMGRTGRWFAFEHDGIVPDVLVIGKAIGAGLPVSAVVTTAEVEGRCRGELRHVQSHQNDPFSGRIAATVISILQDEKLVEQSAARGEYLLAGLLKIQSTLPAIRDVRGRGSMLGVELHSEASVAGTEVHRRLLEAGFITDYQPHYSTFRLFPPFVIKTAEIDAFLETFEQLLQFEIYNS